MKRFVYNPLSLIRPDTNPLTWLIIQRSQRGFWIYIQTGSTISSRTKCDLAQRRLKNRKHQHTCGLNRSFQSKPSLCCWIHPFLRLKRFPIRNPQVTPFTLGPALTLHGRHDGVWGQPLHLLVKTHIFCRTLSPPILNSYRLSSSSHRSSSWETSRCPVPSSSFLSSSSSAFFFLYVLAGWWGKGKPRTWHMKVEMHKWFL